MNCRLVKRTESPMWSSTRSLALEFLSRRLWTTSKSTQCFFRSTEIEHLHSTSPMSSKFREVCQKTSRKKSTSMTLQMASDSKTTRSSFTRTWRIRSWKDCQINRTVRKWAHSKLLIVLPSAWGIIAASHLTRPWLLKACIREFTSSRVNLAQISRGSMRSGRELRSRRLRSAGSALRSPLVSLCSSS